MLDRKRQVPYDLPVMGTQDRAEQSRSPWNERSGVGPTQEGRRVLTPPERVRPTPGCMPSVATRLCALQGPRGEQILGVLGTGKKHCFLFLCVCL